MIPRKTLAESQVTASHECEIISSGPKKKNLLRVARSCLFRARSLAVPNTRCDAENTTRGHFDGTALGQAVRRVALMSDDRTHAIRLHLVPGTLNITSQTAEEGEAKETVATEYDGEELEIGFNAQYLQDFLNATGDGQIAFEFKDGNSQAQLRLVSDTDYDYKYIIMPMRL